EVVTKTTTNTQDPDVLETVSMTYDDANRLKTYNGKSVTYDEKGNMTYGPVDGTMQELTYDCRNRLVEAGGVSYTYDAENTRISMTESKPEGELTTEYVTDTGGSLSRLLVAYEADNTQTTYYYGADGLAAQYNSGTKKYFAYHYDNIGSTTLITAKDGHAVERFSYGTYGELLKAAITKIRFLYNGSYGVATDSNGLYYMRARYYNPDIKRFINQDIKVGDIGSSQSLNRYAYCEGNPVSMVDPFGLCGEKANDQGQGSMYEKWHDLLGAAGMFWDGFDLINGALYAMEGDYVNAAISFACGIPAVGNIIAGVAKVSKAVKAIKTAEKIASACRTVGKIGNTAAGMKAVYDTYQTAQRECKTTTGKIAYIAGTLAAGYAMGKAANWGAGKLKNLASKAMPKLKTAAKEAARKLASRFNKGFGSSSSGHMNRNRGFAILPFGESGKKVNVIIGDGYGVNDSPVRLKGKWSINDMKQALLGHPPKGLGSPDIHHGGQMPGAAKHEVLPSQHRNNSALHPNKYNQGVSSEMREEDRKLHWWYRAREEGADELLPDWIYDD
ncbi:MAG: hypothetical protein K2L07_04690, partial [Lachnospiraceae bacterium]|nr:hypothetical protein [Lachnospiraceae bacterium]